MLLGSPPDMVHNFRLRKTHASTRVLPRRQHKRQPQIRHHPCYSGFQVQGTATAPASMILSDTHARHYRYSIPNYTPKCKVW